MNDPDEGKNAGPNVGTPTDQGEDSEERRATAEKVWRDRSAIPDGTAEDGQDPAQPERQSGEESVETPGKRAEGVDVDDIDEKR